MKKSKKLLNKGQEEMVGFVLIIVLVMIIILVFLGFFVNKNNESEIESEEVNSFIQSLKQYTTSCSISSPYDNRNIIHLIKDCSQGKTCYDSREACKVLNDEIKAIMDVSWNKNDRGGLNGYSIVISDESEELININSGNVTKRFLGPTKNIIEDLNIDVRIYQ